MAKSLQDLALITAKTLEHYNERAAEFWNGTRDHDVKQNYRGAAAAHSRCAAVVHTRSRLRPWA
jgi:hypothetical protein